MENLRFLISKFRENFDENILNKAEEKRKEIIAKFPIENIKDLPLENYALGLGNNEMSLSWWIEYNSYELGSIKGGSAEKHKIYFSTSHNKWKYPSIFENEVQAWEKLREELYKFLMGFREKDYTPIENDKIIYSMYTVRSKLLYIYFPEKVVPIYKLEDINKALKYFGVDESQLKKMDIQQANLEIVKIKNKIDDFKNWDNVKFMFFLYQMIIRESKYYKIAPGEDAMYWDDCLDGGYICVGWDDIGNLTNFSDYDEFVHKFKELSLNEYGYNSSKATEKANEIWTFYSLKPGDIVIANKGTSTIVGIGEVTEKGYVYDMKRENHKHTIGIKWDKTFKEKNIPQEKYWSFKTVYEVTKELYTKIISDKEEKIEETNNVEYIECFEDNDNKIFDKIESNLDRKGNIILYGPPGTGKTYITQKYLRYKKQNTQTKLNIDFCTFHPSFSYEDFIEGYRPYIEKGQQMFKLEDGIFKRLCKKAAKPENKDTNFYLIIDEINRGDVAKIFGEMITLIEKDKRGIEITLSQSKEVFHVPNNVYIIATMNTADRSIKMMDAALRRRFSFIECMPNYEIIDKDIENLGISPRQILMKLNKSLREIEDREKQIGHAYFMKNGQQIQSIQELKEVYMYEIIPLISEYCFNDYKKMSEIIGDEFIDEENEELKDDLIYGVEDYFANVIRRKFGEEND